MQIEHIEIRNYRVFRHATFSDLPKMMVVVGANGSGKSTLLDVLTFLKDAIAADVASAVAKRGGFGELVSRGEQGPVSITIKFRQFAGALATYILEIAELDGRVVVDHEVLRYRRGTASGRPRNFLNFSRGVGEAITNEVVYGENGSPLERSEYKLEDPSILAIGVLGQLSRFPVISELRKMIENWHISNFQIAAARPSSEAGYAEHLSTCGDNVAQVAQYLYRNHRKHFDEVLSAMRRRIPGMSAVEAKPTEDGRLILRFKDGNFRDPFIARNVSDGTIRMFAYLILLYDPNPHPLLAIEEPENQVYHNLLEELAEEFRDYARRGGQAFVATHSTDFLNGARIDEIFHLVKRSGFTTVRRTSQIEVFKRLIDTGDLPGALWRQGLLDNVSLS